MNPLLLLVLLAFPLLGGIAIPLLAPAWARPAALVAAAVQLATAIACAIGLSGAELNFSQAWLPRLGLSLDLGLDGLSMPLVLLTALLTAMAVLSSPVDQGRPRLYFALMLATNLGLVGAFLARNALLFVIAYELILIPTTLLVASFGGEKRAGAAIRFLTYGAVSGVALVAAVLALGWSQAGGPSFAFADLAAITHGESPLALGTQRWIMALVLLAFGLKLPVVPLHGWQPATYSQAPTPVAMLMSGAVSKLGAYGLLRFGLEFLPETWQAWSPWIAAVGAITAIYGALNAISQLDMRRLVAYSSLSHMGFLVLALAAATPLSLQGVVAQMLAHGLIIALLFSLVGLIERKTGTTAIPELSGLLNPQRGLPFTLGLMLLALMAAAGVPGLAGFVAELLVFEGSWSTFPLPTLTCLAASVLTAVYAVRLFNRVGFGRLDSDRADWASTTWVERLPSLTLTAAVLLAGIWPTALTGWSETATAALALHSQPFL
ncbi:NADH-quinone oxidoreductase subunit M [Cyanobium sp. WAJ14-Wanaka]|uniref:NADH-quinone oxidoreductase subunit M n=1 Tax=Cyanobium sp. WAJ14-Wanaka TaxID=2823725 RepID=UPI0020CBE18A|nr:NADH-quinone oxidoreductase subunit M [Cyanobium sp. WAJ14-Wanaka]MCP9774954.1 NADH-quinone oxidoreductase subunit M [Cyanobium sp. WAJ14-Wanaka]